MTDIDNPEALRGEARAALGEALHEMKRVIVGQDAMLERLLVSLLASGYLILVHLPALGGEPWLSQAGSPSSNAS